MKKRGLVKASDVPLLQQMEMAFAPLTPQQQKRIDAAVEIATNAPTEITYSHAVFCQVGLPRKRREGLTFERTSGYDSILLSAGKLWDGKQWKQQELPYGPKPRIVLMNLTTRAVVTGDRFVDVGRSTREFMQRVGLDSQGSEYRALRKQIAALAACRIQIGMRRGDRVVNLNTQPIHRFDAWITPNENQEALWPGSVELSQEFFDSVREFAVPLDERAIAALRGSALALDTYLWLAHRLWRIRVPEAYVPWQSLKAQFGQEYRAMRSFRQEFRATLEVVRGHYPGARVEPRQEGLILRPSPPPVPKVSVLVP